jgi:acyl transferase domain-containing protein
LHDTTDVRSSDIAIVGMAFQLPQNIADPDRFWHFLQQGQDAIGPLPANRKHSHLDEDAAHAGYLEDIATFDASFFEMSGLEATYTDPAQRLFLQASWHALERAGLNPNEIGGQSVGVFAGCHTHDYSELAARLGIEVSAYWNTGLNGAMLANRVSYFYDWHGPSITFNTACSSGLEALVAAVYALRHNRCKTALVGGVNLIVMPTVQTSAARAGMMAPGQRCRTFDANAEGFVRGEGIVTLVLKPVHDALRDGLPICGLIRAAESGHGGRATNLTAPNLKRQRDLIQRVWMQEGILAKQAAFIETHGTGTKLGDSIEVAALREAFERLLGGRAKQPFVGLGALKTQLGHLEAAAGLASIAKICLAMQHGLMPANLHFETQNPILDLEGSPFYVVDEPTLWPQEQPLAGVSAFGFGGSYAHAVLAPGPDLRARSTTDEVKASFPVILSAHKRDVLKKMIADLKAFSATQPNLNLARLAHVLCCHRKPMKYRWGAMVPDTQALREIQVSDEDLKEMPKTRRTPVLPEDEANDLTHMLNKWLEGYRVPWQQQLARETRHLAGSLPTYPFAGKAYFLK